MHQIQEFTSYYESEKFEEKNDMVDTVKNLNEIEADCVKCETIVHRLKNLIKITVSKRYLRKRIAVKTADFLFRLKFVSSYQRYEMFITKRSENNPINLTDDAAYLIKELGQALKEALTEVVIRKPRDPIEFIALFLQRVFETREYERQAKEDFQREKEIERELAEKRANALRLGNERKMIEAENLAKEARARAEKAAEEAAKIEAERMALIQNLDGVEVSARDVDPKVSEETELEESAPQEEEDGNPETGETLPETPLNDEAPPEEEIADATLPENDAETEENAESVVDNEDHGENEEADQTE
ncbi:hypothetical protein SprV_0602175800 [Sparganum proliferum]